MECPSDILSFWFGPGVLERQTSDMESVEYIDERMGVWFAGKSKEFDGVQRECSDVVDRAGNGMLNGEMWQTSDGHLAKVILLDQFTRCIYRGSSLAFQYDHIVTELIAHILDEDWLPKYTSIERFFLGDAIQHSEDLTKQQIGVDLAKHVADGAPSAVVNYFANIKGYPMEHFDVIKKFGRFPSRNLALVSTTHYFAIYQFNFDIAHSCLCCRVVRARRRSWRGWRLRSAPLGPARSFRRPRPRQRWQTRRRACEVCL